MKDKLQGYKYYGIRPRTVWDFENIEFTIDYDEKRRGALFKLTQKVFDMMEKTTNYWLLPKVL